jgi:hypothetical protein
VKYRAKRKALFAHSHTLLLFILIIDFGVVLSNANKWETNDLSDAKPDLDAPPSPLLSATPLSGPKKKGDKFYHSLGARIQALTIFTIKGNTPTTFQEIWN